jgi:phosphonate transport system substrate-binding protein
VDRLRFGTYLAPNVLPVYELVTEQVGRRLGIPSELVVETSYESCVEDRKVDASAIDSQVLAVAMRRDPSLGESLRIIESLGPSTIQPVAVSKRVPLDLRRETVRALVSLADDAAIRERLAEGLVERFVPVAPPDYDDIRMMVDACEAAGFTELR